MITKLLALTFVFCFLVGIQVCVLIFGWGLTPQSWWWIIGGGVFGQVTAKKLLDIVLKEAP